MSSGKVVLGLLAGVATGAIAGLLFAPSKGSYTRKKIAKKGKNFEKKLEKKLKKKFNENVDIANKKIEKIKTEFTDFAQKNMHKSEQVTEQVKK